MGRISEAIMRAILGGRLLKKLKKEVGKGEVAEFDVFLNKETEYMVKGKVLKSRGSVMLSLVDDTGSAIPVYSGAPGKHFSVIPERDGLYHIRAGVKHGPAEREPLTVMVTLSSYTFPGYARLRIAAASYQSTKPASTDDGPTKRLPVRETTPKTELEDAGAMTCCGLSKDGKAG